MIEITSWHWVGFIVFVLLSIAVDMAAFRRRPRAVTFPEALLWSAGWFALAMGFAGLVFFFRGHEDSAQFVAGYVIELSLSLDNVLIIALIFAALNVPAEYQRRVLVWGMLGAVTMRGVMIGVGAELVRRFKWALYVFGALLLIAGVRAFLARRPPLAPEKNPAIRLARKLFPISPSFDGQKFLTRVNGALMLTPLMLALLLVESSDLIFALDSVPAVFCVTQKAFIIFTSNVFAILGLRSLYFVLAGAINRFRHLKRGLAIVLIFVGLKMLLDPHDRPPLWFQARIPTATSLLVIACILAAAIMYSVAATRREKVAALKS